MNNITYFIYFFAISICIFGILLIFVKNLMYAVFAFLGILLSLVALFILAQAEFVGVTQLLVYIGGILILIIFGTMLTNNYSKEDSIQLNLKNITLLGCVGILGWFLFAVYFNQFSSLFQQSNLSFQAQNSIQNIGYKLLTNYAIMFELSGILLLTSLIGALFITKTK